jgi:hypothetical protein
MYNILDSVYIILYFVSAIANIPHERNTILNTSYHEKSLWVSLVSTIVIFGYYFLRAFGVLGAQDSGRLSLIFTFISVVILLILIQILSQIYLAITDRKAVETGLDERDRSIDRRTTSTSYYILVIGIWISVGSQVLENDQTLLINLLMLSFVVAEVVSYIRKLIMYRRGY